MDEERTELPNITVLKFAEAFQRKIRKYEGGGINGVWTQIDPFFKSKNTGIKRDAFFKAVNRLYKKEKQYSEEISFGINGNIVLLFHVMEILNIKSLSELMETSFNKPGIDAYTIDTNIKAKKALKKLDKIYETLLLARERRPRFTVIKVCHDWLNILCEIRSIIYPTMEMANSEDGTIDEIYQNILYRYVDDLGTSYVKFGIRLNLVLSKYREYFFNDTLLNRFNKESNTLDKSKYYSDNSILFLSPLYALYFLLLMNKKFIYSLKISNNKSNKLSFFKDNNIHKKELFEGLELGEYIQKKVNELFNLLKIILEKTNRNKKMINEDSYQNYNNIFKELFDTIFDIYLNTTGINQEWLHKNYLEINNLEELNYRMALGLANYFFPKDFHLDKINDNIQKLEKNLDLIERRNEK